MIEPENIPQFTGDLGQLDHHITALRGEADGIRQAGGAAHTQFQRLSAFYQAPEAEDLFASTAPVRDRADGFGDKLATVADALAAYATEVAPIAARLKHLRSEAVTFVAGLKTSSGAFDEKWTHDQDKVDRHQALMNGVAEAKAAFTAAEIVANNKITALVGGTQYMMEGGGKALFIPRGVELYGYTADALEQMEKLPWGTPVSKSHTWWDPRDFGYYAKSHLWDGLIVDNVWGVIDGVGTLLGAHGTTEAGNAWEGLGHVVVGADAYLLESGGRKSTGFMASDYVQGSKVYAKEAAKAYVAWDMWKENPARASATVLFNLLTLGAGPLKAASAGKVGATAKVASVTAKIGDAIDPINAAARVTVRGIPKISEVTANLRGLNDIPDLRAPHSVLELSDGSKVIVEDGKFVPVDGDGKVFSDAPRKEATVAATPEGAPTHQREPVGVGATSRAPGATAHAGESLPPHAGHDTPAGGRGDGSAGGRDVLKGGAASTRTADSGASASGTDPIATDANGARGGGRHGAGATSREPGSGDTYADGRGGHRSEGVDGSGESDAGSHYEPTHDHGPAHADASETREGHEEAAANDGTDAASEARQHGEGDGEPDFTRPTLPPGQAELSLRELRALRAGRHRYTAAEEIAREMFGGGSERHYRVPMHDHPYYPVETPGGRKVDVPVDMPGGRTLAVEIKHYLEFRTVKLADGTNQVVKGEVPLSKGIIEQINKDLTLRRLDPRYDPRWVFLHAPPSPALRNYLVQARIIFVEFGPAPKK
ncbi:hypothetical protein [Streptomyces sp. NPDC127066]|uniref:hypothetical protein n=1 Tax=Streptomyces sp. NPDC127066 TaxID=3347125 RepID=UPI00365FDACD